MMKKQKQKIKCSKAPFKAGGKNGFSLVEALIVLAIIGIISTIAVPNVMLYSRRAKQKEGLALMTTLYGNMQVTRAQVGWYLDDLVSIGFRPEGEIIYRISIDDRASTVIPRPENWYCDEACISTNRICNIYPAPDCAKGSQGIFNTWTEAASAIAPNIQCPSRTEARTFITCASANLGGANVSQIGLDHLKQLRIITDGTQ